MTLPPRGHGGTAAVLGVLAGALFFSTALVNLSALAVSIVALWYWFRDRPFDLLRHPICVACLAFLLWVVLRDLAGGHTPLEALRAANEFRPLLFLVLWAPLFAAPLHRKVVIGVTGAGLLIYATTAIVTLLATGKAFYVHHIQAAEVGLPPVLAKVYAVLLQRGADLSGPVMVLAIFGSLQLAWDAAPRRGWWLAMAGLCSCALLFSSGRRTSQLAFVLCAMVFVWLNARRIDRRAVLGLAAAALLSVGLLAASPMASKGARQVMADLQTLVAPAERKSPPAFSSGGERLRFWAVAHQVIRLSPVFGASVSDYPDRFRAMETARSGSDKPQFNPHNEYLYVLGALGAVGLLLYLALHATVVRRAFTLGCAAQRKILLLFMTATLSSILFNSMLVDMIPGHFFTLALLCLAMFDWSGDAPAGALG